jgi:hypothetical protein
MSNFLENLPLAGVVSPADLLLINQSGVSKKIPASSIFGFTFNYQTGTSYPAVLADTSNVIIRMANAAANLVTVPKDTLPIGACLILIQYGAGQSGFVGAAGVTLRNPSSNNCRVQYSTIAAIQDAANEWILCGDLA